jgi:hypothetical protein
MKNILILIALLFATSQVIAAQIDFAQISINKDKKKDKKKKSSGSEDYSGGDDSFASVPAF